MATDTNPGFKFMGTLSGGIGAVGHIQKLYMKDTEKLYKGDMLNVESGEVDLAVTGDTAFLGAALETVDGVDSTDQIEVYTDPDAIYAIYDPNARTIGTLLDLTGSAGAQGVTTSSNGNFVVVANSTADEWTLVRITSTAHALA